MENSLNIRGDFSKKDAPLLYISLFVIILHVLLPFFMINNTTSETVKKKTALVVKTVRLQETTTTKEVKSFEPSSAKAIENKELVQKKQKEPLVIKKESIKKEAPTKKEVPAKKEVKKLNSPKKIENEKLTDSLAKAKESLSKMDSGKVVSKTPKKNESKIALIGLLSADTYSEEGEGDYTDELQLTLKQNLKLPEYGKVDILLTLSSKGEVLLLKIENSKSVLNADYVQRELPRIKFAPFNGSFAKKSDFLFHILLTNDD